MKRNEIESTLELYFKEKPDLSTVILFGSAGSGRMTDKSDIDIAIAAPAPISSELLAELQLDLSSLLGRTVDLVDLRKAEGLILREILTKGIKILNRDPLFLASQIKKMLFFEADMMPNIRLIHRERARRFANGT